MNTTVAPSLVSAQLLPLRHGTVARRAASQVGVVIQKNTNNTKVTEKSNWYFNY